MLKYMYIWNIYKYMLELHRGAVVFAARIYQTKWFKIRFEINLKMVNTIWFRVDSIRFRKYFSTELHRPRGVVVFAARIYQTNYWNIKWSIITIINPNQSENGKYNLISVWFNKISLRALNYIAAWYLQRGYIRPVTEILNAAPESIG